MQIAKLYPLVAMLVVGALSGCGGIAASAPSFVANVLTKSPAMPVSVYVTQANGASDGIVYGDTAK